MLFATHPFSITIPQDLTIPGRRPYYAYQAKKWLSKTPSVFELGQYTADYGSLRDFEDRVEANSKPDRGLESHASESEGRIRNHIATTFLANCSLQRSTFLRLSG
jgi:hypothetical protein